MLNATSDNALSLKLLGVCDTLQAVCSALLTCFFLSFCSNCSPAGVCTAFQCGHNQDGCEQPGHGNGSKLSALSVGRPSHHLWEHPQGDVLPANAHRSPGYKFYRRGGVDYRAFRGQVKHYIHARPSPFFPPCSDHTGNCWLDISLLWKQPGLCNAMPSIFTHTHTEPSLTRLWWASCAETLLKLCPPHTDISHRLFTSKALCWCCVRVVTLISCLLACTLLYFSNQRSIALHL